MNSCQIIESILNNDNKIFQFQICAPYANIEMHDNETDEILYSYTL